MRKAPLIIIALLIISAILARFSFIKAEEPTEAVSFSEKILFGDRSKADGIELKKRNVQGNRLLWESRISFGADSFKSETNFSITDTDVYRMFPEDYSYVGMELYPEYYDFFDNERNNPYYEKIQELVADSVSDEDEYILVRHADFEEFYPLSGSISLPEFSYGFSSEMLREEELQPNEAEVKLARAMQTFFKIPVISDEYLRYYITRTDDGTVISGGFGMADDGTDSFSMSLLSAYSDSAIYSCFDNRTAKGNIVDTSHIPGGYGIYILPYGRITEYDDSGKILNDYPNAYLSSLRLFYPVNPEARIIGLNIIGDKSEVLMQTVEEDKLYLSVIDCASAELVSKILLREHVDEYTWVDTFVCEDNLILKIDYSYLLLCKNSSGIWEKVIDSVPMDFEKSEDFLPISLYENGFAFDGDRLVVVGCLPLSTGASVEEAMEVRPHFFGRTARGTGFFIAVYDKSGLCYYGEYSCSLDEANISAKLSREGAGFYGNYYDCVSALEYGRDIELTA